MAPECSHGGVNPMLSTCLPTFKLASLAQRLDSCTSDRCWQDTYSQMLNLEKCLEVITVRVLPGPGKARQFELRGGTVISGSYFSGVLSWRFNES